MGRLEPEKGIDTLLDAWRAAGLAHARLALAGAGPSADKVASHGGAVRSLGYVAPPQLPALYAAADALVLPSVATATFKEPWGLVVNEAMLQQTPVIASDAVGAAAAGLVADDRTGLVFAAGDSAALADRMRRLATDVRLRETLGVRARTAALELDPAAWAHGMRAALDSVLTGR